MSECQRQAPDILATIAKTDTKRIHPTSAPKQPTATLVIGLSCFQPDGTDVAESDDFSSLDSDDFLPEVSPTRINPSGRPM